MMRSVVSMKNSIDNDSMEECAYALLPCESKSVSPHTRSFGASKYSRPRDISRATSERLARLRNVRVNVLRNGCSCGGFAMLVPHEMKQFLDDLSERFDMNNEERAYTLWNEFGFKVHDISALIIDELIFVGCEGEDFYGKSGKPSKCMRIINMFLCCNRRVRNDDDDDDCEVDDDDDDDGDLMLSRKRRSKHAHRHSDLEDEFWLHPDFDISKPFLQNRFTTIDSNANGVVTHQQFSMALKDMKQFQMPVERLDEVLAESPSLIDKELFVKLIQELAVSSGASLCSHTLNHEDQNVLCYDYSPTQMCMREFPWQNEEHRLDLDTFVLEPAGPAASFSVRWVHVVGHYPATLQRLADVYGLDQLEVQDAMAVDERCRVVKMNDNRHYQIVLRMIRPKKRPPLKLQDEQLCIFWVGNSVMTVSQNGSLDLLQQVRHRLKFSGSKIRVNNSAFLVYSIIDAAVDFAGTITRRFESELRLLEKKVHSKRMATPNTMENVHRIRREMRTLRDWVRPLQAVINRLVEGEQSDTTLKRHFLDVFDNVIFLHEKVQLSLSWVQSLNEHYQVSQAHRMNEVMYILTLVTTIFVPAQFLSSVFGMNFQDMPELKMHWAYPIFWIVTLSSMIMTLIFFRKQRWI